VERTGHADLGESDRSARLICLSI